MGMHQFCLATCTCSRLCVCWQMTLSVDLALFHVLCFLVLPDLVYSAIQFVQPLSVRLLSLVPLHLLNIHFLYSLRFAFRYLLTSSHSGYFFFLPLSSSFKFFTNLILCISYNDFPTHQIFKLTYCFLYNFLLLSAILKFYLLLHP